MDPLELKDTTHFLRLSVINFAICHSLHLFANDDVHRILLLDSDDPLNSLP